ncbi:MAG: glycosyltransferase [Kiritimatiellae bacterium]|nr:glycosyltransferase [Kiritimatiellia bacterium]
MRIGWDFSQVPATRDGTFFYLLRCLQAVSAHPGPHEHKLYATDAFLAAADGGPAGFAIESTGPGGGHGLQLARERFFLANGKRIRRENDILLALWNPPFAYNGPVIAIVLDAIPFLNPRAVGGFKALTQSWIRIRGARRAAAWLCMTETTARTLAESCGFDATRLFVAGCPFPPVRKNPGAVLPEGVRQPFAFYCAARSERKNHARLVRAWRKAFPANECQLVLAGRTIGKLSRDTKETVADGIRAGAVRDLGEVDDATRDALYGACEFAVYPSLYEGFGMPVLEAVAAGKGVLVHRGSACEEVGGGAVLACDCTDEDALALGLKTLATDGFLRNRLAQARAAVLDRFSEQAVAAQILRAAESAKELP